MSKNKGIGGDSDQIQVDAAVQHGNFVDPVYDENGNFVGATVFE